MSQYPYQPQRIPQQQGGLYQNTLQRQEQQQGMQVQLNQMKVSQGYETKISPPAPSPNQFNGQYAPQQMNYQNQQQPQYRQPQPIHARQQGYQNQQQSSEMNLQPNIIDLNKRFGNTVMNLAPERVSGQRRPSQQFSHSNQIPQNGLRKSEETDLLRFSHQLPIAPHLPQNNNQFQSQSGSNQNQQVPNHIQNGQQRFQTYAPQGLNQQSQPSQQSHPSQQSQPSKQSQQSQQFQQSQQPNRENNQQFNQQQSQQPIQLQTQHLIPQQNPNQTQYQSQQIIQHSNSQQSFHQQKYEPKQGLMSPQSTQQSNRQFGTQQRSYSGRQLHQLLSPNQVEMKKPAIDSGQKFSATAVDPKKFLEQQPGNNEFTNQFKKEGVPMGNPIDFRSSMKAKNAANQSDKFQFKNPKQFLPKNNKFQFGFRPNQTGNATFDHSRQDGTQQTQRFDNKFFSPSPKNSLAQYSTQVNSMKRSQQPISTFANHIPMSAPNPKPNSMQSPSSGTFQQQSPATPSISQFVLLGEVNTRQQEPITKKENNSFNSVTPKQIPVPTTAFTPSSPTTEALFKKKKDILSFEANKVADLPATTMKLRHADSSTINNPLDSNESVPFKLQDFILGKNLGKGQFGQVFLVRHKLTGFLCALKILQKKQIKLEKYQLQIARELAIQFYLNHYHISSLYGFFEDGEKVYLLVEYCAGGSLYKCLRQKLRMEEPQVAAAIKEVCVGIKHLHNLEIIHRDVKPQNVLFQMDTVKLCDFGWAIHCGQTMRRTQSGSPLYYPPEIVEGNAYDFKIDAWCVGMMTYQCLIGRVPFKIYSQLDLKRIVSDDVQFPCYVDVSDDAKDFILKALNKVPEDRLEVKDMLFHPFLTKGSKQDTNKQEYMMTFKAVLNS